MATAVSGTPRPPATGTRTDPLPVRLLLARRPHDGSLDGAWWPRPHRPATELTALVAGLASRGVVVSGLSLSVTGWDSAPGAPSPRRPGCAADLVRLPGPAHRHPGARRPEITLLVIPPEATQTAGARAMTLASVPDSATGPDCILTASEATSDANEA
jgi:Family of unknown function (DUF5994)